MKKKFWDVCQAGSLDIPGAELVSKRKWSSEDEENSYYSIGGD
jgi:hypothetical protein